MIRADGLTNHAVREVRTLAELFSLGGQFKEYLPIGVLLNVRAYYIAAHYPVHR